MKNYNKPNLEIVKIAPDKTIASGMAGWLEANSLESENHITAYAYANESA